MIKEEKWIDYEKMQRNAGVLREQDFLQSTPMGDMLLLNIEANDIEKTFLIFAAFKDPFDQWLIEQMKENTGVDFSQPMSGLLPELVVSFKES